jgi:hypothetical protein
VSFSKNPSNTIAYVGMPARFSVATSTDSSVPPTYQWRRGGVNIANATTANYTIVASLADTASTFDCIASVPGLSVPSTVATVTVPASGGFTVTNRLRDEQFTGMTANVRTNVEIGNTARGNVSAVLVADVGSAGANYGERVNGFFTPAVSGRFVFFVAADDDTDLFVSTDDQPSHKQLVAQETVWSNNRNWITPGGASIASQKRSDQFTPDGGVTLPFSGGIQLTAGTRYYVEAVHAAGGGGNGVSFTALTTNDVALGLPLDGDASTLTNATISFVTTPVTTFTITNQPIAASVFEGDNYTFVVGVLTDSEVNPSYQWKKNGQIITNATAATYVGTVANIADSGSQFICEISLAGQTTMTTVPVSLTVKTAAFAAGQVKREIWLNDATTRALVGANAPGTVPVPNVLTYVNSFDVGPYGAQNYVQRLSGFFVPATSGLYVFFVASDDDTDLYLSTNDRPDTKRIIARENAYSNQRQWNASQGGSVVANKRSDTFTTDGGLTYPGNPNGAGGLQLTAGTRYYIEAVHHNGTGGEYTAITYGNYDPLTGVVTNAPVDGDATRLTGARVGVLLPAATVINITLQPTNGTVYGWQPVNFATLATNDSVVATVYQWRRTNNISGMTNIPGATFASYGFITSTNDNGAQFDCVATATAGGLTKTSNPVSVTIQAGASFVAGSLAFEFWNAGNSAAQTDVGGGGYANSNGVVSAIDFPDLGRDNYAQRVSGFFIPPVTTNYVFFTDSDDENNLYLSPDDQPNHKVLIAQQPNWAPTRYAWNNTSGGASSTAKRSDLFTPIAFPGATTDGIPLVAGKRYYLEGSMHEGTGGDWFAVTYMLGNGGSLDPLIVPTNGTPPIITSAVLGRMAAPSKPVLTVTRSGGNLNISWTPAGGTLKSSADMTAPFASWTTVGTANPATVPIGAGNLFLHVEQ